MQVIKDDASLATAIRLLESRDVMQTEDLQLQWEKAKIHLSPGAIVKDVIKDTLAAPDFKASILKGAVSLATGFATKKVFVGASHGLVKSVLGSIIQTGVTGLAFKNADPIKSKTASFLSGLLKKMRIGE